MSLSFFVPSPLAISYYGGLFLWGGFDDIRQMITIAISKLAILTGVRFLFYAAEGAVPDYIVGSLHLDNVERGMLSWLAAFLVNIASKFWFYKIVKRMRMDPALVALAFQGVTEIYWSSPDSFNDFVSYDFAAGTVQGYPVEMITPVKRQKVDDSPLVPSKRLISILAGFLV